MLVGEFLHKSLDELDAMGQEEIGWWLAFIKVKNEREEAAAKRRKSKRK